MHKCWKSELERTLENLDFYIAGMTELRFTFFLGWSTRFASPQKPLWKGLGQHNKEGVGLQSAGREWGVTDRKGAWDGDKTHNTRGVLITPLPCLSPLLQFGSGPKPIPIVRVFLSLIWHGMVCFKLVYCIITLLLLWRFAARAVNFVQISVVLSKIIIGFSQFTMHSIFVLVNIIPITCRQI